MDSDGHTFTRIYCTHDSVYYLLFYKCNTSYNKFSLQTLDLPHPKI